MKRHAVLLLAAGLSTRFATGSKLVSRLGGRPLARWAIDTVAGLDAGQAFLVAGPRTPESVERYARGQGLAVARNASPEAGLGTSIVAGVGHLGDVEGVFLCLADMPFLGKADFRALAAALDRNPSATIAATAHGGRRGHPVLFRACHFAALSALDGDAGAGRIVEENSADLITVPVTNPGVLFDVDTEEDLKRAGEMRGVLAFAGSS